MICFQYQNARFYFKINYSGYGLVYNALYVFWCVWKLCWSNVTMNFVCLLFSEVDIWILFPSIYIFYWFILWRKNVWLYLRRDFTGIVHYPYYIFLRTFKCFSTANKSLKARLWVFLHYKSFRSAYQIHNENSFENGCLFLLVFTLILLYLTDDRL